MRDSVDIAFGLAVLAAALFASGHAVIYKRESRSASLWVILIWVMPALGPILYLLMGVNRVQRRAARMRAFMVRHRADPQTIPGEPPGTHLAPLARMLNNVVERPLLPGNSVEVLVDGAQAYPAMLEAIESARASIMLASYIFDADGIGARVRRRAGARARSAAWRCACWSTTSTCASPRRPRDQAAAPRRACRSAYSTRRSCRRG